MNIFIYASSTVLTAVLLIIQAEKNPDLEVRSGGTVHCPTVYPSTLDPDFLSGFTTRFKSSGT